MNEILPAGSSWNKESVCYLEYPSKKCLVLEDKDGKKVEMKCRNYYKDKEYWVQKIFEYYRKVGFPAPVMSTSDIQTQLNKLKEKDSKECINSSGEIKNAGRLCLDVSRHFCKDTYWKCSSEGTESIYDAFMNDDLLMKVLKNRCGFTKGSKMWSEDNNKTFYPAGTPYCFDFDDAMLFQGFRSTMIGFPTSNFKPLVAKFLIERYCPENGVVGDYSAGWIARAMGAWSCNRSYYSIDPATHSYVNNFAKFVGNSNIKGISGGSEDPNSYTSIPEVDYWFSSPPYEKQEIYVGGQQSVASFNSYDDWLNGYWKETVKNCCAKLKKGGKFSLIMIKEFDGKNLLEDMSKIIESESLLFLEDIPMKTSRSHLTKTAGVSKTTEVVRTFVK